MIILKPFYKQWYPKLNFFCYFCIGFSVLGRSISCVISHLLVWRYYTVTSFTQSNGKINGIICVKPIGRLGSKVLHMNTISSLFITTLWENEIKWTQLGLESEQKSGTETIIWKTNLTLGQIFFSRSWKMTSLTSPFLNWFSVCDPFL